MARAITTPQRTQLASRRAAHFLRVECQDAIGQWRDLRAVNSADYQLGATVSSSLDAPTTTATVTLRAGRSFASIAPGMTGATANATGRLLDVGRGLRIDVAVVAPGSTPGGSDWIRLFDGVVDAVATSKDGQVITLRARDRLVPVLDAMVENVGLITGGAVESILQQMLNSVVANPPTIVTPVSPAYSIATVPRLEPPQLLWQRMQEIIDRIGWLLRYRWNGNTPQLTLFGPVRQPTAGDVAFTWAATELRTLDSVDLDLTPIRNRVHVDWRLNGVTQRATASNGVSQTLYGTRTIVIREEPPPRSPIDNATAAQRFADAILADLQAPALAYRASHNHVFWPIEVGDVLDVAPDGVVFDATQRLGVVSVEHRLDAGGGATTVGLRGAPASKGRAWLSLGGAGGPEATDPTTASASFLSTGAVRVNVIGPTEATQVRAAVSTAGAPSAADVDAATGSMAANASMAALTSAQSYAVGTTVFVAAAAYVGGVRGRVVQLQIQRDAAAGTVAVGPDLEVRLALSATDGTVTYLGDGTIEISEDGSGWSAAPASPFSRARGAQGSDTVRTVTLRATLNGQSISNTVVIPARATVDTDTVTPDLRLIRQAAAGGDAAQFVEYVVQATNPKAGGPAPSINGTWIGTTVERFSGSWIAISSNVALFPGDTLRLTRPAYDATPGTFTARATLGAGQGAEEITLEIPPRPSPLPPAVVARISGRTATTITVTVTTEPAGGSVRWLGGTAALASGPAVNTDQPAGTSWTFTRPALNAGDDSAEFRGTVAGIVDDDSVVISEQGRDTVPLLTRARVIDRGPTSYTVRVSASAPYAERDASIVLVQASELFITLAGQQRVEGNVDAITQATSDGYYGPIGGAAGVAFRDYVVTRPAVGEQPARVTFRVSAPGTVPDLDSVEIEPQRPLTPARIEVIAQGPFGAGGWSIGWRAWNAAGAQITNPANVAHLITQTPIAGAPSSSAGTPVWSPANNWWITDIGRTAGADVKVDFVVDGLTGVGTARTVLPVPIPTYTAPAGTAGPRFTFAQVNFAGPGFDQVELQWGALDMPSGVQYEALVQVRNVLRRFVGIASPSQIGIGKSTQDGSYPVLTRVTGTLYALDNGQRIAEIGVPETVVYVPTNET